MSAIWPYRCTGRSSACTRPGRRRRRSRIEAVIVGGDVRDHRDSARLRHRLERRDEGRRRDDHLVAGLESRCEQPEPKSVEPTRDADAVIDAAVRGECLLEAHDGRAVGERARFEKLADLFEHDLLQRRM